jgi:hypothetical protein
MIPGKSFGSRAILLVGFVAAMLAVRTATGATIPVYLNFDSNGVGSFRAAINTAANNAGLGLNYFPAADIPGIETAIQNEMSSIYGVFNIAFTTTANAAARTETFGDAPTQNVFGLAPFNYRNAFLANSNAPANDAAITAQIFSSKFAPSLSGAATLAQNETRIAIGVADTGSHELGHTFGLDHQDEYGDPAINPANYHATGGVQNTHIMASGVSGLSNDRSTPRRFGQLENAKLGQSVNVYTTGGYTPNLIPDAGDNHTQRSTAGASAAQPITFKWLNPAGESVVTVTNGSIGTAGIHDVYSFTASAGSILTADIIALSQATEDGAPTGSTFFKTPANTLLSLYEDNGGSPTLIDFSSDKQYSGNDWLSGNEVDGDPMILNRPLPATDTYYLDVQGVSTGNYEMFVSVPEPASISLLVLGSFALMRRRSRRVA